MSTAVLFPNGRTSEGELPAPVAVEAVFQAFGKVPTGCPSRAHSRKRLPRSRIDGAMSFRSFRPAGALLVRAVVRSRRAKSRRRRRHDPMRPIVTLTGFPRFRFDDVGLVPSRVDPRSESVTRTGAGRGTRKHQQNMYTYLYMLFPHISSSFFNQKVTSEAWRRERDSNPRYGFPHTRTPSVRLRPLGHPSGTVQRSDSLKLLNRGLDQPTETASHPCPWLRLTSLALALCLPKYRLNASSARRPDSWQGPFRRHASSGT